MDAIETQVVPVEALIALEKVSIDTQIATAKQYPRDLGRFFDRLKQLATSNEDIAKSCFYVLPRAGKQISGPSVRFAEIVALNYGNLRIRSRILGRDNKVVKVLGEVVDLENNVGISAEVERRITKSDGTLFSDDMITTTTNAASAIAIRNALFKVVPKALTQSIYEEVKKIALGAPEQAGERFKTAVEKFAQLGVGEDKIFGLIKKKKGDIILLPDVEQLIGVYNAIRDGDTTIDEVFSVVREAPGIKK